MYIKTGLFIFKCQYTKFSLSKHTGEMRTKHRTTPQHLHNWEAPCHGNCWAA